MSRLRVEVLGVVWQRTGFSDGRLGVCICCVVTSSWEGVEVLLEPAGLIISTISYRGFLPSYSTTLIRRRQPPRNILPTQHILVLSPALLVRSRNRLDHAVVVGVAEVRDRVPRRIAFAAVVLDLRRRLDDAVLGGLDGVVGPLGQQVASVDDDGAFDGGRVDEGALGRAHLQTAAFILEEEGDGAWIRLVNDGL
jgi:hypothetical protein